MAQNLADALKGRDDMAHQEEHMQDVMDKLSTLAPTAEDAPQPASLALARIKREIEPQPRRPIKWRLSLMFKRKYVVATALTILVLVLAFSFPAVRAAASDFLGLFRVQKFAPISISAEQLALLEEVSQSGIYPGEIEMINEPGEPQPVDSLGEAESIAGWMALGPSALGEPDEIYFIDGGSGRLTIDVENARLLLGMAGADPNLIADSLDGAIVDVTIYPGIGQNWGDGVALIQAPTPLIDYPDDVDTIALGQALLQVMGMDEAQAYELASSIDWTTTLLLPIPENVASFNEVTVNGGSGLALSSLDGLNSAVLWEKDGTVFALSGGNVNDLVDIANSVR